MALVDMGDLMAHGCRNHYAVAALDIADLDFLTAAINAAERCDAPVVLTLNEPAVDPERLAVLMPAMEAAAQRTRVPVAIQLSQIRSLDSAVKGIALGCHSLMVRGGTRAPSQGAATLAKILELGRRCGVSVEGELQPSETRTPMAEAIRTYLARVPVDWLGVALEGRDGAEVAAFAEGAAHVAIPLAVDDGTDLTDEQVKDLIHAGVAKIGYRRGLLAVAAEQLRKNATAATGDDYSVVLDGLSTALERKAERAIRTCAGVGQAEQALAACRPWQAVEHLIIYNLDRTGEAQAEAMMAEGRSVLSKIPGVRRVTTGYALKDQASYQYCWLVRFAHPAVIDTYWEHPDHKTFADDLFRPHAQDRISIDYLCRDRQGG